MMEVRPSETAHLIFKYRIVTNPTKEIGTGKFVQLGNIANPY